MLLFLYNVFIYKDKGSLVGFEHCVDLCIWPEGQHACTTGVFYFADASSWCMKLASLSSQGPGQLLLARGLLGRWGGGQEKEKPTPSIDG